MSAIIVSMFAIAAALVEPGFSPIGGHDGVAVFQKKAAAMTELAATGEFDASPAEVQMALLDYGNHPRVNPHLAESTVLTRGQGEQAVYQHLKLPVIKDRDFTLLINWTEGQPNGIRFHVDNSRGPGASKKAVRMTTLTGQWELRPIRGGTATYAIYHVKIDFAGSVPKWMISGGAAKDLPNVFTGIRKMVNDHRNGVIGAYSKR
jgi:hypothetical protein